MAIKQIDEIPQGLAEKRRSYREAIRKDIEYALDHGITKFEFVGDWYNYKTLAQYAREEAERIFWIRLRPLLTEKKKEHNLKIFPCRWRHEERSYIKVTSHKQDDRVHVYCEVVPDWMELAVKEIVERQIDEEKKAEERKKRREAKDGQ